jgi:CBS domain containing-hemolysin-like protein
MLVSILAVFLMLSLSAFFSADEIAFTSINARRVRRAAEDGDKKSALVIKIYDRFDDALSAILIGNNLVNIAATSLATVVAIGIAGEAGAGLASVIMTVVIVLFSEITPKILAKRNAEAFAKSTARALNAVMLILMPVVKASLVVVEALARAMGAGEKSGPAMTEAELTAILETAEDEGVIDEERTDLVQSALQFDDLTIAQVLTPRIDMVAVDVEDSLNDVLRVVIESQYSRIPVYEDTIDNVIGILHVNQFLRELDKKTDIELKKLLMPPLVVHKTLKLDDALKMLQRARTHIAVVADEYGGTMGIITLEDLLEQLVGEIWDENDDILEPCVEVGENMYECSGLMGLHDFFDEIDYDGKNFESEYTTLGGWAVEMLDAQPEVGRSFDYDTLHVTVEKMDGVRVDKLRVTVDQPEELPV